jgi:hypothetical protein
MGGEQSRPLGGITRQELLQKTAGSQRIVNEMFQEMITRLTPEDFLKLGNPQTCNKFIFMMADTLHAMFTALRIRPKQQGDYGVILFEDAEALRKPTPESKKLCLYIAYFYIRIFQIFGALALTVLDDPSAGPVLDITRLVPPAAQRTGLFGRVQKPQIQYGVRPIRPQMGGAEPASFTGAARYFSFMSSLFMEPINNEFTLADDAKFVLTPTKREYNFYIQMDANTQIFAQLTPSTLTSRGMERSAKLQFTRFFYNVPAASIGASLVDSMDTLKRVNNQLRYLKQDITIESNDGGNSWYTKRTNQPVSAELEAMSKKIQGYIKQIAEKKAGVIRDGKIVHIDQVGQAGLAAAVAVGQKEDPFVTKALQNQYIINTLKALSTNKPVAYCVARALQLVDADTLFSRIPKPAQSSVCFGTFMSRPSSVPKDGTSLDSVPGLRTLDHLYYTHPTFDQDKREITVDTTDKQEYAEFLQKMSTLFGKPVAAAPHSLTDIKATANPACVGQAANKYLQITDPKAVATIIKIVNQMFKRQLDHTQKVMTFFKTYLFQVAKSKNPMTGEARFEYRLNPKLLAGGLQGIDNISKVARQLLLSYYTECETTYQQGLRLVLQLRTA